MRCRILLLAAAIVPAASGAVGAAPPELGTWTREPVVLSDVAVNNPDIVALGGGQFRMYFMRSGQIESAFSADEGDNFGVEVGIRVDGQHPALVVLPDGRLRMYFVSNDVADDGAIRSALSDDGLTFVQEPGIRLRPGDKGTIDSRGVIHLCVVKLKGGGYRMYYDAVGPSQGGSPNWRGIVSATSEDGLRFRKDDGVRIKAGRDPIGFANMVWSPFVERYPRGYKLYFSVETDLDVAKARAGIYLATSDDGLGFRVRDRILGIDPAVTAPTYVDGGMQGLPQDAFVIDVTGGRRIFYWQAQEGTFSAFLALA